MFFQVLVSSSLSLDNNLYKHTGCPSASMYSDTVFMMETPCILSLKKKQTKSYHSSNQLTKIIIGLVFWHSNFRLWKQKN
jgi:hypothetical protein